MTQLINRNNTNAIAQKGNQLTANIRINENTMA